MVNLSKKKNGDESEQERKPIWEQLTLVGDRSVTYAKEGMLCAPVKLTFAAAGILEQQGYAVPEYALKGKKVPIGGKVCVVVHQAAPAETLLTHGSLVSSFAEIAKTWVELGAMPEEIGGADVLANPSDPGDDETGWKAVVFEIRKGEGQFGQLWLEPRK